MKYYTPDNTSGYTQAELDALNAELDARLTALEPHTDAWYEAIHRHNDEVAGR
jgi:hypothetical protein